MTEALGQENRGKPPSVAVGLLLNMLLPGLGFSYLGRDSLGFAWFLLPALAFAFAFYHVSHDQPPLLIWLYLASAVLYLSCQIQYVQKAEQDQRRVGGKQVFASACIKAVLIGLPLWAGFQFINTEYRKHLFYDLSRCINSLRTEELIYFNKYSRFASLTTLGGRDSKACPAKISILEAPIVYNDSFEFVVSTRGKEFVYLVGPTHRLRLQGSLFGGR